MRRFIIVLAASAAILTLMIASGGTVAGVAGKVHANPDVQRLVVSKSAVSPHALLRYWTQSRLAAAALHGTEPTVKPAGRRPLGLAESDLAARQGTVTALEPPYENLPERAVGRIFFKDKKGNLGICSGAVVNSSNESVVWTAAHCLHSFGKAWYRKFVFVPGYAGSGEPFTRPDASCPETECPYGVWPFRDAFIPRKWRNGANLRFDFGALVLATKGKADDSVQDAVGSLPMAFNAPLGIGTRVGAYGYPVCQGKTCPKPNPYSGLIDFRCNSEVVGRDNGPWGPRETGNNSPGPPEIAIDCLTLEGPAHGHSGGPWLNPDGRVISNHSYGHRSGDTNGQESFGPYLGRLAKDFYKIVQR